MSGREPGAVAAPARAGAIRLLDAGPGRNLLLALPALLPYLAFVLLPILVSAGLSLTEWNGISRPVFVGLGNYARLAGDARFRTALENNGIFILFYAVLPLLLGLALSSAISLAGARERIVFRLLVFLPYVMPTVLIGIVWQWLYNPAFGPIAQTLRAVGLGALAIPFLGSFTAALPSVGAVATWYFAGFCTVILLSGLQRLDPDLFEAARLDGAGRAQTFRFITLPSLMPEIRVVLLLTLIASVRAFDLVFAMTRGGPGTSTLVTNIYMYVSGFQQGAFGFAAAIAVVGTALVLALNGLVQLAFKGRT